MKEREPTESALARASAIRRQREQKQLCLHQRVDFSKMAETYFGTVPEVLAYNASQRPEPVQGTPCMHCPFGVWESADVCTEEPAEHVGSSKTLARWTEGVMLCRCEAKKEISFSTNRELAVLSQSNTRHCQILNDLVVELMSEEQRQADSRIAA